MSVAATVSLIPSAFADPAPAVKSGKYWVYIGTYTSTNGSQGIYRCELDVQSGGLSEAKLAAAVTNPSFLAISPDGKFLYAAGETADGGEKKNEGWLHAFRINADTGDLTKLNSLSTGGGGPCYVSVNRNGQYAIVANYGGGSTALFRLKGDGSLDKMTDFRQHEGKSPAKNLPLTPHAHCAKFNPCGQNECVYVVDLGLDRVFTYTLDSARGVLLPKDPPFLTLPEGCGPRHIAFSPGCDDVYVNGESNSTLITLRRNGSNGLLQVYGANGLNPRRDAVASTLPKDVPQEVRARNSTAEVVVHPDGKHVLVSNRGHNSVAIFRVSDAETVAIGHIRGVGDRETRIPRNFNIDPTGKWILIAGQDSGAVRVARWDGADTKMTDHLVKVDRPVCVKFLAKP